MCVCFFEDVGLLSCSEGMCVILLSLNKIQY